MIRHFTSSGYIVWQSQVLLHWHEKVGSWLPPGGHIEINEDPAQAVLREIREEVDLDVEICSTPDQLDFDYPLSVPRPEYVLIEDIDDPIEGAHQHIDMIYFCRPLGDPLQANNQCIWLTKEDLENVRSFPNPAMVNSSPPPDVSVLALKALRLVGDMRRL